MPLILYILGATIFLVGAGSVGYGAWLVASGIPSGWLSILIGAYIMLPRRYDPAIRLKEYLERS
jgi:hypothetical protein